MDEDVLGKAVCKVMARQQNAKKTNDAVLALQPRVELVDNWHVEWTKVLSFLDRAGHRSSLHIDDDGWLSARQAVFAAFIGETVVGHLCFRIQPIVMNDGHVRFDDHHKAELEAFVECYNIDAIHKAHGIGNLLVQRAQARAAELNCQKFRMDPSGSDDEPRRITVK